MLEWYEALAFFAVGAGGGWCLGYAMKMDKVKEFGRKHWKKLAVGTAAVAGATIAVAAFWTSDEDDETLLIEGNSTDLDDVDVEHEPTTDDAPTEDA